MEMDIYSLSRPYDPYEGDGEEGMPVQGFNAGGDAHAPIGRETVDPNFGSGSVITPTGRATIDPGTYVGDEAARMTKLNDYFSRSGGQMLSNQGYVTNTQSDYNPYVPTLPIDPATGFSKRPESYGGDGEAASRKMLEDYTTAVNAVPMGFAFDPNAARSYKAPQLPTTADFIARRNKASTGLPIMGRYTDPIMYSEEANPNYTQFKYDPYGQVRTFADGGSVNAAPNSLFFNPDGTLRETRAFNADVAAMKLSEVEENSIRTQYADAMKQAIQQGQGRGQAPAPAPASTIVTVAKNGSTYMYDSSDPDQVRRAQLLGYVDAPVTSGFNMATATDLMRRAMTTGAPTSEFDKYGGYAAVKQFWEKNGGTEENTLPPPAPAPAPKATDTLLPPSDPRYHGGGNTLVTTGGGTTAPPAPIISQADILNVTGNRTTGTGTTGTGTTGTTGTGVSVAPGTNIPFQALPGTAVSTAPGTNIPFQALPGTQTRPAKANLTAFNAAYNNNRNLGSVMGMLPQGFSFDPNRYFRPSQTQTKIAANPNLIPNYLGQYQQVRDRLGNPIATPTMNLLANQSVVQNRAEGGLVEDEEDREASGAKQMLKGYEQLTGPRETQVVRSPNRQAVRSRQASQIVDKQGRPAGMSMTYESMSAAQGSASPEQMATAKAMLADLMRQNLTKRRFAEGGDVLDVSMEGPENFADGGSVSNFTGGASDKKGAPDDKLTFGDKYLVEPALDLYSKIMDRESLPANKRIFLDSVRGGDRSQITEKNFSPSELAQMDEMVRGRYKGLSEPLTKYGQHLETALKGKLSKEEKAQYMTDLDMIKKFQAGQFTPALMALAEGEEPSNARRRGLVMSGAAGELAKLGKILPEVKYSDYPTGVVQKSRSLSAGKTPTESNATSLGQFRYGLGPEGNFVIKDMYDFNPRVGSEELDAVPALVTEGPYGRLREYAGRKMPPGQGRDVLVNLPKRAEGSPEEGEGYMPPTNPFAEKAAKQAGMRAARGERSRVAAAREKVARTPALDEAGGETTDEFIQRTMGFDPSVNEKRGTFLPMPIKRNGKTEFIAPNIVKDVLLPYNLSSQALTTKRFNPEDVPTAATNLSLASLATGKAPAGSLGMAVRPTGSTLLTGPVGLKRKVGNIDKILDDGVTNAFVVAGNDDQQKTLIQDFWNKKARNYFTRQFGTPDDPIATGIAKKRIKGSALEKDFPDYMIDQLGVGKTRVNEQGQTRFFPKYPRAEEDFTKRYDKATGLEGIVLLNNPAASEPGYNYLSRIGRGLTQDAETKEIDRILNQNVRPELINTSIRGAAPSNTQPGTYIGGSTAEELFKAYEEAAAYNRMTPEQQRAWATEEYGNGRNVGGMSLVEVGENLMPQNMRTAVEKGEPIYQAGNMEKPLRELFNPESINQYLTTLPLRELANIRFEDAVRGGLKVRDDVVRLENLAEKIKAGKPVPDSVFSEGVSAPLLQFAEGPLEGFSWKRIEKRQATVPEGAYVGHSVGGYETGGIGYGRDRMEGFNEGRWQIFTLRDARNRPVNTVEVRMDAGGPTVTQIKGNGRATGNTAPEKYDTAVLSFLQNYLKPTKIAEKEDLLTPILQSYKRNLETNVEANEIERLYQELALEPNVIRLGQEAQPQPGAPNAREQLQLQQDLQEAARARIRARAGRQAPE